MGKITSQLSDHVIFTMDDPRNENVSDIISDLTKLIEKKTMKKKKIEKMQSKISYYGKSR